MKSEALHTSRRSQVAQREAFVDANNLAWHYVEDRLHVGLIRSVASNVLPIELHDIALDLQDLRKVLGSHELIDRCGQAAAGEVESGHAQQTVVYGGRNLLLPPIAIADELKRFGLNSQRLEKLTQREREHAHDVFVSDRQRGDVTVEHAQKRPGFYVVEPPVVHEELYSATCAGAFLNLVDENDRLPGRHGPT